MIRLYLFIGGLLLFSQLAVGRAAADQSIRHGAVEFFLGDSQADTFSVSIDRQADGIEPTVLMRSNPTRLVIQTSGHAFQGGKSFRLKGAAVAGVYFVDRAEGDLVVVQIASDARVLFAKEALGDSRFRLNFSLQAPGVAEPIVAAGPSPTPVSTEPIGQSTEEFLQGVGKVLLPKRRDTLAMPELDGLDGIEFDDSTLLDNDTLEKLTKGVEGIGSLHQERVLQIHVDAPAPKPHEDWLVPGLLAATAASWVLTLLLLFQRAFGTDRTRRRKRPPIEPPGGDPPFSARRPARKTARQLLVESYATLGLRTTDSDDDVKTRYKHLVKVFHADTLGSRDLPEEMLALANEQFRRIQEAYEAVKQHRGIH